MGTWCFHGIAGDYVHNIAHLLATIPYVIRCTCSVSSVSNISKYCYNLSLHCYGLANALCIMAKHCSMFSSTMFGHVIIFVTELPSKVTTIGGWKSGKDPGISQEGFSCEAVLRYMVGYIPDPW